MHRKQISENHGCTTAKNLFNRVSNLETKYGVIIISDEALLFFNIFFIRYFFTFQTMKAFSNFEGSLHL